MNQTGRTLLAGLLLLLFASGLARISQLLAPHLPWPLLTVFIGGGLGMAATGIWQQGVVKSWPVMLAWCILAAIVLAVAEHCFAWQILIAAQEAEWLKNLRTQPQLGAFPSPFQPPSWTQFMSGGDDPWRTWAWWIFDASVKGLVAVLILKFCRGSRPPQISPPETNI